MFVKDDPDACTPVPERTRDAGLGRVPPGVSGHAGVTRVAPSKDPMLLCTYLHQLLCWSLTFLVINPSGVSYQPDISQPPQRIYSTLPNYCKRVKAGQILSCEGRSCEMK